MFEQEEEEEEEEEAQEGGLGPEEEAQGANTLHQYGSLFSNLESCSSLKAPQFPDFILSCNTTQSTIYL